MVSKLTICLIASLMISGKARMQEPSCSYMENLERLLEKYVRYEHKLSAFSDTLAAWETKFDARLKDLDKVEAERNDQVQEIKNTMEKLKQGIDEDRASLQKESEHVETRLERKEAEVNQTLAAALKKHADDLRSLQDTYSTPTVIFSAKYVSDYDISTGKVIKFTTIISNIGDGYDSSTGYFTTPYTGLYMFTTTLCSNHKKRMFAHLIAANATLAATYKYNGDTTGTCTSISGMAKMTKGEKASVEGAGNTHNGALYSDTLYMYRWPSFSGMLVHV